MRTLDQILRWARLVKRDVVVLCRAARDPRVPWYAKLLAGLVAGYALSPIDLIPDFIPVIGYLDDAIIVPLGILLTLKLIPRHLVTEFRSEVERRPGRLPTRRLAAAAIISLWLVGALFAAWAAFHWIKGR